MPSVSSDILEELCNTWVWKHLIIQHFHSPEPEIIILQRVANTSHTYQVSDRRCNLHSMSTKSINTIDFHTGLFALVSCGLGAFCHRDYW